MPLPLTLEGLAQFPKKEGVLDKKSPSKLHVVHKYETRFFVLAGGHLKYYKGSGLLQSETGELKGDLDLALTNSIVIQEVTRNHVQENHVILTVDDHMYNLRAKTPEEAQSWHTMLQQTYEMCVQAYEFSVELKNVVIDMRATRALTELRPKLDAAIANCQRFGFCEDDMEAALKTQMLVHKGTSTGTSKSAIDTTGLETSSARTARKFSTAFSEATAEEKAAILNAKKGSVLHEVPEDDTE